MSICNGLYSPRSSKIMIVEYTVGSRLAATPMIVQNIGGRLAILPWFSRSLDLNWQSAIIKYTVRMANTWTLAAYQGVGNNIQPTNQEPVREQWSRTVLNRAIGLFRLLCFAQRIEEVRNIVLCRCSLLRLLCSLRECNPQEKGRNIVQYHECYACRENIIHKRKKGMLQYHQIVKMLCILNKI